MARAVGVAAGTLFIAIGAAAQFGGAGIFGTPAYPKPVSHRPSPQPAPTPSASPLPSPSGQPVTAAGSIYRYSGEGGGHGKKKKG